MARVHKEVQRGQLVTEPRIPIRAEVLRAAEDVIARYHDVFRKLAS